jgi:TPR repeat protein
MHATSAATHHMPTTPSRRARDQESELQSREAGRQANEMKYTEFQLGCSAGEAHACTSLGEWYSVMRSDFVKAAELYTEACLEKRHPQACLNLGMFLCECHFLHGRRKIRAAHKPF